MPPRSTLANSFTGADANNEVICPLKNNDGTSCRKRCFGEKRYRSMQEHIRRAHPLYYTPKLPANEESFRIMVNSSPSEKPKTTTESVTETPIHQPKAHRAAASSPVTHSNGVRRPSMMPAAAALAQLHNTRVEHDWDADHIDGLPRIDAESSYSLHNYLVGPGSRDAYQARMPPSPLPKNVSPTELMRMPIPAPDSRASSMQPFPRVKVTKPKKNTVSDHARQSKHERDREREFSKRFSRGSDMKSGSIEPNGSFGNKWEDLLEAAASASEADCRSRDMTPAASPRLGFPALHGLHGMQASSYTASPLQNSVLPRSPIEPSPSFQPPHLEPFPSVESIYDVHPPPADQPYNHQHHSSNESLGGHPYSPSHPFHWTHHNTNSSGSSFPLGEQTISTSPETTQHKYSMNNVPAYPSNTYSPPTSAHAQNPPPSPPLVQHYCAACHRVAPLANSYACVNCICGVCQDCVNVLQSMNTDRVAKCPRCAISGAQFKPFMLDLK